MPAIIRVLLMQLINTPSKVRQLSRFSGYFSLPRFMIFKFSHSGSHLKKISWRMQHLVTTISGLLIWVCRYLTISLNHRNCAGSCIPSSQLPRSKHSPKLRQNPPNIRVLLSTILLHFLPLFPQSGITLACSNPVLCQTCHRKILSRRSQILPHRSRIVNHCARRSTPRTHHSRGQTDLWRRCEGDTIPHHFRHPPPHAQRNQGR